MTRRAAEVQMAFKLQWKTSTDQQSAESPENFYQLLSQWVNTVTILRAE